MNRKLFDTKKVLELHNSGMLAKDIAKQMGCSYSTVKNYLKELGISPNKKRIDITQEIIDTIVKLNLKDKKTNKQISEIVGITTITIKKILTDQGLESNSLKTKSIVNQELILSDEQKAILYGSLLGDASLGMTTKNARFQFVHGSGQEKYFDFKCSKFEKILGKVNKTPRFDKRINKLLDRYSVRSLCHPIFTELYNELYPNGIKKVTIAWLNKLTEESLAYWFMDDGSHNGTLCTNSFSYNEHLLIQKYFKERWNIEVTIQKDGKQFMIYFPKKSKEKFAKLIKPYVIESMSYKIKNWIP